MKLKDHLLLLFGMKKEIDIIIENIIEAATGLDTHIKDKFGKLKGENLAELYLYNFVFGYYSIQGHESFQSDEDILLRYVMKAYKQLAIYYPKINSDFHEESFFMFFTRRYKYYIDELLHVKKMQLFELPHVPVYFYSRLIENPLIPDPIGANDFYGIEEYEGQELAKIYLYHNDLLQKEYSNIYE